MTIANNTKGIIKHENQSASLTVEFEKVLTPQEEAREIDGLTSKMTSLTKDAVDTMGEDSKCEGRVEAFDHVTFWVGNAKHSAIFFMTQFGFEPIAFKGLETGCRDYACHVVKLNNTIIQFKSAVEPNNKVISDFLMSHGDACKDVAFRVENIEQLLSHALDNGAELVKSLEVETFGDDEGGKQLDKYVVKSATIKTFGDITHTFIERNYEYGYAKFLPGFRPPTLKHAPVFKDLAPIKVIGSDHIVGQFPPNQLDSIAEWYSKVLNFKRYWSVDEKQIFTEHSGVKSHVVANHNQKVMMPLCEVMLSSKSKSKAEEFVRYNNGSGIHHIALLTDDIVSVVANLRDRGVNFLNTPDAYYDQLKERLVDCPIEIAEDIEQLRKLKILVDFDEQGYLLQIFTRPVQDRPTLVFEFIQRYNHDGFGAGNFLALFKAIEAETKLRGNL